MPDIIILILGGVAMLVGYILLHVVFDTVISALLHVLYWPFKPLFDWLIFDRPFWQEGTFWRDMDSGLRLLLIITGGAVVVALFVGLIHYLHYLEFKNS